MSRILTPWKQNGLGFIAEWTEISGTPARIYHFHFVSHSSWEFIQPVPYPEAKQRLRKLTKAKSAIFRSLRSGPIPSHVHTHAQARTQTPTTHFSGAAWGPTEGMKEHFMNNLHPFAPKYAGHLGAVGQNGGRTSHHLPSRRDTASYLGQQGRIPADRPLRERRGGGSAGLVHMHSPCSIERARCLLKVFTSSD